MGKTVFVPLTDDLLYEHPDRITGPAIPFIQEAHWAAVESVLFSSTKSRLDTKTKLETAYANPTSGSKRDKASPPQGGSLR